MMWTEGGILYTDRPRQQAPNPMKRTSHKATEWKVDWWLGRIVETPKGVVKVIGSDIRAGAIVLIVEHEDLVQKFRIPLLHANAALRKGDWSLV